MTLRMGRLLRSSRNDVKDGQIATAFYQKSRNDGNKSNDVIF